MDLAGKILSIVTKADLSADEFIDRTGWARNYYFDVVKGRRRKLTPLRIKQLIDAFPHLDAEDFIDTPQMEVHRNDPGQTPGSGLEEAIKTLVLDYNRKELADLYRVVLGVQAQVQELRQKIQDLEALNNLEQSV